MAIGYYSFDFSAISEKAKVVMKKWEDAQDKWEALDFGTFEKQEAYNEMIVLQGQHALLLEMMKEINEKDGIS